MAKNKPYGDNKRKGEVKKRVQAYNPKNKRWVEINTDSHLFLNQKADKYRPFKGVRKHK
jgi:hypothetical protein